MSAAASSFPSNAPTPERRRQNRIDEPVIDAREFRPGWRIRTRLDQLLDKDMIDAAEYRRAVGFRRTYEAAHRGAVRGSRWDDGVYVDPHCHRPAAGHSDAGLDAISGVRRVEHALGALYPVLLWLVVDDLCWAEIARRLGVDARTARGWAAAAVAGLAAV